MRLFSLKKSINVVLVFSILLIYLLNAVGCAPGLADWSYALPNDYELEHINAEEARKFIESKESKRAAYYNYYTGKKWGAAESYDLCIDSSILGLTDTEKIIAAFIRKRFEL